MRKLLGAIVIAIGIFLEVMWLGVCFGSIIIGVLLLIFAPSILFFPFNFFLVIGLSIMNDRKFSQSYNFKNQSYTGQRNNHSNRNRNYQRTYQQNHNTYTHASNVNTKYYEILESKESDGFDVIKANYRRLVKEYHYDSIASKNLPDEMVKFAEEKTKAINEAYSVIKELKK